MIQGARLVGIEPSSKDVSGLKTLIESKLNVDNKKYSIPNYIKSLFHHFLFKKEQIMLGLYYWTVHFIKKDSKTNISRFGYKKFSKYFIDSPDSDDAAMKYSIFIKLMTNLKKLTVIYCKFGGMKLSDKFVSELLKCIEILNNLPHSQFNYFQFAHLDVNDINEFLIKYSDKFVSVGWKLLDSPFVYKPYSVKEEHSLFIQKV